MSVETVYQVVHFDAVKSSSPELGEVMKSWNDGEDLISNLPQDLLKKIQEEDTYLLMNKNTGEIGMVGAPAFALNYEHDDPTKYDGLKKSIIERIIEGVSEVTENETGEEFLRGANAVLNVITKLQAGAED